MQTELTVESFAGGREGSGKRNGKGEREREYSVASWEEKEKGESEREEEEEEEVGGVLPFKGTGCCLPWHTGVKQK